MARQMFMRVTYIDEVFAYMELLLRRTGDRLRHMRLVWRVRRG